MGYVHRTQSDDEYHRDQRTRHVCRVCTNVMVTMPREETPDCDFCDAQDSMDSHVVYVHYEEEFEPDAA